MIVNPMMMLAELKAEFLSKASVEYETKVWNNKYFTFVQCNKTCIGKVKCWPANTKLNTTKY